MKNTDLPACPKCGMKPQFHWRNRSAGACHGSLSCHFRHYRVEQAYHAGAQEAARELLIGKWIKLVEEQGAAESDIAEQVAVENARLPFEPF